MKTNFKNVFICFILIGSFFVSYSAFAISLEFSQLDFDLDGSTTFDSDWGMVDLTYTGSDDILYLNLAVNSTWQIQNIPVLSHAGSGIEQSISYLFDLDIFPGIDVSSVDYDYQLTDYTLAGMPTGTVSTASVSNKNYTLYSGAKDTGLAVDSAASLVGDAAATPEKHAHSSFPNQQAGSNECAPTAISNSLQFLKEKHGLDIPDSELTIDKMKDATNWDSDGCWISHNDSRPEGEENAFWEDKDEYMKEHDLGIITKKVTKVSELVLQIDMGHDVELELNGHTVALVGITPLADGTYSLDIAHDTDQDNDSAGTVIQTITYDPTTDKISGLGYTAAKFNYAVVEYPVPEPFTINLIILGLIGKYLIAKFRK